MVSNHNYTVLSFNCIGNSSRDGLMLLAFIFLFLQTIGDLGVDVKAMKLEVEKLKEKVEKELADLKQQQTPEVCFASLNH